MSPLNFVMINCILFSTNILITLLWFVRQILPLCEPTRLGGLVLFVCVRRGGAVTETRSKLSGRWRDLNVITCCNHGD